MKTYEIIPGSMTIDGTTITVGLYRAKTQDQVRYLEVDVSKLTPETSDRAVGQMFNDERLALEEGRPSVARFVL